MKLTIVRMGGIFGFSSVAPFFFPFVYDSSDNNIPLCSCNLGFFFCVKLIMLVELNLEVIYFTHMVF